MPSRLRNILTIICLLGWFCLGVAEPCSGFDARKADSLRRSLHSKHTDTMRVKILLRLAATYGVDSPAKSFYYASEALFGSEKAKWAQGICSAELQIAICYIEVWELQEAIEHLHKSIRAAKQAGDLHSERNCWQYLVHCYDHLGEHQKAFECQDRLMTMVLQTGDTFAICRQMSAYATVMFDDGGKQEGLNWLNKDVAIAERHLHGDTSNKIMAELLNTLAITYLKVDKKDSAFLALRRGIPLAIAINDTPNVAYLLSTMIFAHLAVADIDSAEYYGRKTMDLAENMKDLGLQKNTHNALTGIYEKKGKAALALYHYKAGDSISTLMTNSEKTLEQSMQVSRVAIEQQRAHREQEKKDLEMVNADQRKALIVIVGVLVALAVITGLVLRNLRNKANTNKIIKAQAEDLLQQNEMIDAALKDKEMLLQEMHHRVKNNLQLINSLLELQIDRLDDKNSVDALTVTQQRIHSMAMVHSRLYLTTGDASVQVHQFATDLFRSLASAFSRPESNIEFRDRISEMQLPLNMLVPLGLILNELITNSFKHAFKDSNSGTIDLDLQAQKGTVVLVYKDTGPGMVLAEQNEQTGSMGIYLIKRLTRQLKGEMSYSKENGSAFTFTFPYEGN